jgi:acyl carrier protein phosphodiesterase
MNITDTSTNPRRTANNQQELVLDKWKRLYHDIELLIDIITWVDDKRGHKHPLEVMLYDVRRLITRLEHGLK